MTLSNRQCRDIIGWGKDRKKRGSKGWDWKKNDIENKKCGYKPIDRETFIKRMNKSDEDKKQSKEELEETLCQLRALKTLRERLLK